MKTGWLLLLSICLLSAACAPSPQEQAEMTSAAQTGLALAWTRTPRPTIPPTATTTPLPTNTHTPTISPTTTRRPTATPTQTASPEPGRYYAPDKSYSLISPVGWQPKDVDLEQPGLFGSSLGEFSPNLIFIQEESLFPVDFYAAMVQDSLAQSLTDLKDISEDFLVTDFGQDYFRWEMENSIQGVVYHQVLYFFEAGDQKMVVTYTRPRDQGEENDPLVEAAIKSLRFSK